MTKFACKTCGVQHAHCQKPPATCPICNDDRQYLPLDGQQWVDLSQHQNKHDTIWRKIEENVYRLSVTPHLIGIGQSAHFIQTKTGNFLWDCMPLANDQLVEDIKAKGGLKAIAISHPHFYSNVADWSATFGNIPIYIHENDRQWVQEMNDNIVFWQGDSLKLHDNLTLVNCGGHFDGSTALHLANGANGQGSLFSADTIVPNTKSKTATFMHSYPNSIPLPAHKVAHIGKTILPYKFQNIYGSFGEYILGNADDIVQKSVNRYIQALNG